MARVWKIVRHGAPDRWEESVPEEMEANGRLVVYLGRLARSHLQPVPATSRTAPQHSVSLTVKNDRRGNKSFTVYASGSRIHYVATLEEAPASDPAA
jgi:hypothetical protein